jgi:hypothetical protein
MRAPDLRFAGVGMAGFESTASSSRTAGTAVDRGCCTSKDELIVCHLAGSIQGHAVVDTALTWCCQDLRR